MKISNADFRQLAHSIKYLEYYWSEYKVNYPEKVSTYKYSDAIELFIKKNKYYYLSTVKKSILSNDKVISRGQYKEIIIYAKICENIKEQLKIKNV